MTRKLPDGTVILEHETPDICEFCGAVEELRPYGPNRERVCFDCMKKNELIAKAIFAHDVLGISVQ